MIQFPKDSVVRPDFYVSLFLLRLGFTTLRFLYGLVRNPFHCNKDFRARLSRRSIVYYVKHSGKAKIYNFDRNFRQIHGHKKWYVRPIKSNDQ